MRTLMLRLYEDTLPSRCPPVFLPATPRAIYVSQGSLWVETADAGQWLPAGTACVDPRSLALISEPSAKQEPSAEQTETRLWRWELTDLATPAQAALPSAPATVSVLKLQAEITLDTRFDWLMRCDEVCFPPGGVALLHIHQGPGIRICIEGKISIETQGSHHTHTPGQAWFESGPAPVLAPTTEHEATRFIRCFVLPRALKGRTSIRYVRSEDEHAPKVQTYRVFAERDIELPE